jgi:hypothetical protein
MRPTATHAGAPTVPERLKPTAIEIAAAKSANAPHALRWKSANAPCGSAQIHAKATIATGWTGIGPTGTCDRTENAEIVPNAIAKTPMQARDRSGASDGAARVFEPKDAGRDGADAHSRPTPITTAMSGRRHVAGWARKTALALADQD